MPSGIEVLARRRKGPPLRGRAFSSGCGRAQNLCHGKYLICVAHSHGRLAHGPGFFSGRLVACSAPNHHRRGDTGHWPSALFLPLASSALTCARVTRLWSMMNDYGSTFSMAADVGGLSELVEQFDQIHGKKRGSMWAFGWSVGI